MTKPKLKKILVYGVLAVTLIGAATYIFLIQREKSQFVQAEKEIDALYAQIVEKVGKPNQEKKETSCGYASRVYGKGPRSCTVSHSVLYTGYDHEKSNQALHGFSSYLGTELYDDLVRENKNQFTEDSDRSLDQNFSQKLSTKTILNCSIQYKYPVRPSVFNDFSNLQNENLAIYISCGGPALAEYFPTKD